MPQDVRGIGFTMTQIRLDKVQFYSNMETYLNYTTLTSNISVSGNIADGATSTFSTSITYARSKTRADLYAKNLNTGTKMSLVGGPRIHPYQFVSSEVATLWATYTGSTISIFLAVTNNTGAAINLIAQTLEISAVLYEVPLTT